MKNNEKLDKMRHSCAHLLAAAVKNLYPKTKLGIGPVIESGFYYDFEFENPISEADFPKIELEMKKLQEEWEKFEEEEVDIQKAKEMLKDEPYKLDLLDELEKTQNVKTVTFYKSGDFIDLCKGGHVHNAKEIGSLKLLSVAGAYWRRNEKNKMLTRIYGTCFKKKKDLDEYLKNLEEAKKRDHRKIGKEQELFFIDETVGKGLVMWLPKGNSIKEEIEKFAKQKEEEAGYLRVSTPHIAKEELFIRSGHLPYYKESMYPPMEMDDGVYYLKAMNCPHHHQIYLNKPVSYKELPIRIAEYGTVYRNELSGTLAGLLRVRGMQMNDAHIYCRRDQIKKEFKEVMKLTIDYLNTFEFKNYWFRLSKWNANHMEKYFNEPENWEFSQKILREVLEEMKVDFVEADDEAAFYGPKVDVQFKSIIGREETMSTIQLDFAAKERFGLSYVGEDGKEKKDVFVIHRAPLSTHERFMAYLIEQFAGAFPLWLSPVQIVIMPIADRHAETAEKINSEMLKAGIRSELNDKKETLQSKIREATLQKVPYMGIIGDKEVQQKELTLSVRTREGKDLGKLNLSRFLVQVKEEIDKKA